MGLDDETASWDLSGPPRPRPSDAPGPIPIPPGFVVEYTLGQGAFGVVYRAREEASGREVALKVSREPLEGRRLERFRREGEITARLQHPGIVKVHSAGEVEGHAYLVYELIKGACTLEELLGILERRRLLELLRDAARGLGHAHDQGVIHRDVKPANLLVDRDGRALVADFGLARAEDQERLTRTGATLGTPVYMSPEQIVGGQPQPASDVWALGVILYRILSGLFPFDADDFTALGVAIVEAKPRPPRELDPRIPEELEALCLQALSRRARDRPRDGTAFAEALDAWLRADAALSAAALPPASAGRGSLLVFALSGAVVVLGLALVFLLREPPAEPPRAGERTTAQTKPAPPPAWFQALEPKDRPAVPLPPRLEFGATPGEYRHARDGSVLVWIPPGEGRRGVFLGKHEVTAGQFRRFQRATRQADVRGDGPADLPVSNVTWQQAQDYSAWIGGRLPSEEEWAFAARGPEDRTFPWGALETGTTPRCNAAGAHRDGYLFASPVGSFREGASPFGCLDMAGNVWEWVAGRIACGGSFADPLEDCRTTRRRALPAATRATTVGFRVCVPARTR